MKMPISFPNSEIYTQKQSWFQTYTYQRTYLHIFLKGKGTFTVHLNISTAPSVTYLDRQLHTALIRKV